VAIADNALSAVSDDSGHQLSRMQISLPSASRV